MKILIVTYEFPPIIGGAGIYAHDLAIGLSQNQINVDILTYYHDQELSLLKKKMKDKYGVKLMYFHPVPIFHFLQFLFKIVTVLLKTNYDYVILNDGRAKRIFSLFSFLFRKTILKSVSILHGNEYNIFIAESSIRSRHLGIPEKFLSLLKRQLAVIAVSASEYDFWITKFADLKSKLRLINHGVCEDIFYKRNSEEVARLKRRYGVSTDQKVAITASRLVERKGQDTIIEVLSEIKDEIGNFLLIVCGDGNYRQDLEVLVKKKNLENNVRFVGGISRQDLSKYLAISDFFALVSRFEESFGLVYIEAAACGLPAIAGDRGGTIDAVEDGISGYIVSSTNKASLKLRLTELFNNRDKVSELGSNAYERYKMSFTSKHMANNLIKKIRNEIE